MSENDQWTLAANNIAGLTIGMHEESELHHDDLPLESVWHNIHSVLAALEQLGCPVVSVRSGDKTLSHQITPYLHTEADIIHKPTVPVYLTNAFHGWENGPLHQRLQEHERNILIAVGHSRDACMRCTIRAAHQMGYWVISSYGLMFNKMRSGFWCPDDSKREYPRIATICDSTDELLKHLAVLQSAPTTPEPLHVPLADEIAA